MTFNKAALLLSIAALAHTPAGLAQSQPGYFGVSVGQATVEDFCGGGESSCDDTAPTFRVYGGSQLSNFANLEFGYRYTDDVEVAGVINGIGVAAAVSGHFIDTTLQLGLPESGPFKFYTKAGLMLWRLDLEISANNGFQTASDSDSDTGVALRTGLGASYQVSDALRLRADWDFLVGVGDDDEFGETDINVFSVGPEFVF